MDISNDKLVRLHCRLPGHDCEKENSRETDYLLVVARNNAIRTNYIKAKIDNVQQNSNCSLYRNKDEPVNHMISWCSILAQNE